jgi:hypothetical protein
MRRHATDAARHERLLAIALTWLAGGSVLLASTLVPAHTALLGWAPLVWLLAAPLALLVILEPARPRRWPQPRQARRRH